METKTNYKKVGLAVILLSTALIFTIIWLSSGFNHKKYQYYTVYMSEPVTGLTEQSHITYNGVNVGAVSTITLSEQDPRIVNVLIKVEEGTPITTSTRATLITQGITGLTYLGLSSKSATLIPLQKKPGEAYPVILSEPSLFIELQKNLKTITSSLNRVLTEENTINLKKSLEHIEKITATFAKNEKNINQTLADLPKLTKELKAGAHEISIMAHNMSVAGQQTTSTMQAGKSSIDKFSQQTLPPVVLLLRRLDVIAANLEKVSAQMRQNPSVIIRGSAPIKPGPGE